MSYATPPVLAYTHRGRRPFPFRTVAAAAFAVPVLLLWARSYWRADQLNRYAPSGDGRVESESGGLYFEVTPRDPTLPPGWYVDWVSYSSPFKVFYIALFRLILQLSSLRSATTSATVKDTVTRHPRFWLRIAAQP
jgi:hypothetical protein